MAETFVTILTRIFDEKNEESIVKLFDCLHFFVKLLVNDDSRWHENFMIFSIFMHRLEFSQDFSVLTHIVALSREFSTFDSQRFHVFSIFHNNISHFFFYF